MTARAWIKSYGDLPAEIDAGRHPSVTAMLEGAMQRDADRTAFNSFGNILRRELRNVA